MIEPILGSKNAERVLIYLLARDQGYAREIARSWGADPNGTKISPIIDQCAVRRGRSTATRWTKKGAAGGVHLIAMDVLGYPRKNGLS